MKKERKWIYKIDFGKTEKGRQLECDLEKLKKIYNLKRSTDLICLLVDFEKKKHIDFFKE